MVSEVGDIEFDLDRWEGLLALNSSGGRLEIDKINKVVMTQMQSPVASQALAFDFDQERQILAKLASPTRIAPACAQYSTRIIKSLEQTIRQIDQADLSIEERTVWKKGSADQAKVKMGTLLYAFERSPQTAEEASRGLNPTIDLKNLRNRLMIEQGQEIKRTIYIQSLTGLQGQDVGMKYGFPREIAKMLLDSKGQLNLGLIPIAKKHYAPSNRTLKEWEENIGQVLDQIDGSWQPVLDGIRKPEREDSFSNDLIRAELGLSRSVPLTDVHAKQVALAAALSQLTQGPVGNCFAVAWAIKKHNEQPLKALQDYGSLLQYGYLSRPVNGKPEFFFFLPTLSDPDLRSILRIDASGKIAGTQLYLWDHPGIRAACRLMGIDDPAQFSKPVLQLLSSNQIRAEEAIYAFAQASTLLPEMPDFESQFARGKYGFNTSDNRLLRATETALAGMAESRKGNHLRDGINACVKNTFAQTWKIVQQGRSLRERVEILKMERLFSERLDAETRFVYNSAIALAKKASDGSSTAGGFVLYQKDLEQPNLIGKPILTATEFSTFTQQAMDQIVAEMKSSTTNRKDIQLFTKIALAIESYTKSGQYANDSILAYLQSLGQTPDPNAINFQVGDNPIEVETIDTGMSPLNDYRVVRPQNPYDLIHWILELVQWKEETQHYLEDDLPDELDSAISPQHAFNLSVENEEMKTFLKSGLSSVDWLNQRLVKPGLEIANLPLDAATRAPIQYAVRDQIASFFQNKEQQKQFISDINNYIKQTRQRTLSLSETCQGLVDLIVDLTKGDPHQIGEAVDTFALPLLPSSANQIISQQAVRFAKTNWNHGDKNIYFCAFYNPRTKEVDFGRIDEDRTNLTPVDEAMWVNGLQWAVDPSGLHKQ